MKCEVCNGFSAINQIPQASGAVAEIVVKQASIHPASSVKDRISISMVAAAKRSHLILTMSDTIS
jgi:cysteine synthase